MLFVVKVTAQTDSLPRATYNYEFHKSELLHARIWFAQIKKSFFFPKKLTSTYRGASLSFPEYV